MRVFFIYILFNLLMIPLYLIQIVAGGTTIIMNSDSNIQIQILQTYAMMLSPNILLFILLHFADKKLKTKRRWNALFFLIAASILLYVVIQDLLPASYIRDDIW